MKKFLNFSINTFYFLSVIALALVISTMALTKKVNQSQAYVNNLKGSVVKEKVVVLTLTRGIIDTMYVKNGQVVKKGETIVKMSNPVLESNFKVFQGRANNESAQTQANIAKVSLDNLTIKAPVDGVVGEVYTAEGSSVDEFSKIMLLYSADDIRFQADLTAEQYQRVQKFAKVNAYNARLNQGFVLKPGLLKAEEKTPTGASEKRIGLYFTFENNKQASALVNNEDLIINLEDNTYTRKPIDFFIDFWNGLLARNG